MEPREGRLYFIKQTYFDRINDPYIKQNKTSGLRPHYLAYKEKDGLCWMVPLTSRIAKYKNLIEKRTAAGKNVYGLDIVNVQGIPAVFLFQDMIPVPSACILKEYVITRNGRNQIMELSNKSLVQGLKDKGRSIAAMLQQGIVFTPTSPDIPTALEQIATREFRQTAYSSARMSLDDLIKANRCQDTKKAQKQKSKVNQDREK